MATGPGRHAAWLLAAAIYGSFTAATYVAGADAYFVEDFETAQQSPNLESYGTYYDTSDGRLHRKASTEFADRRYVRTLHSDYHSRDFSFEVTFTTTGEIVYIGLGEGVRAGAYNEPGTSSIYLSLFPQQAANGDVRLQTKQGEFRLDRLYSAGPHRVRIEKIGNTITFQVDEAYNGAFEVDISATLVDLKEVAPFLGPGKSRLFFGTIAPESFDDIEITDPQAPPPDCNGNGVADSTDIAGGTSQDTGSDGVPDECQIAHAFFVDRFEQATRNPSLEGYGPYFTIAGGVIRREGAGSFDDRRYLRTVMTDYNERDFRYDLTFTTTNDIVFMGIGEGVRGGGYNEPANSCTFRIHPQVHAGVVRVTTADEGEVELGKLTSEGPHHARIEKQGAKITFSIDDNFDGTYKPTFTRTFTDLAQIAPFLNDRNSRLFFGAVVDEVYFDDLEVIDLSLQGPDCNQNGKIDSQDIASGASKDENLDGIPDECAPHAGKVELVDAGSGRVRVVLENAVAVKGGELGLAYDPAHVIPMGLTPLDGLPSSVALRFDPQPGNDCAGATEPGGVAAGFTVGWVNSISESVLTQPGRHEILELSFSLPPGGFQGGEYTLRFVRCLGVPEAPVRNIVTDASGKSQLLATRDGAVTIEGKPVFRRGDANDDGSFDISDAIVILGCLFIDGQCPGCQDAMDANDDGDLDLSDGIHLLSWRFLNGAPPPAPFPACGPDREDDAIASCVQPASCE